MIAQFATVQSQKNTTKAGTSPTANQVASVAKPLVPDKAMSVREFILQLESRKHTELVLAFGYYLEKHSGQPAFVPADINNLYYEAKLDTSNTSQMIIQNIKRGLMMEAKKAEPGGRKQYVLTNSGEKLIEGLLRPSQN